MRTAEAIAHVEPARVPGILGGADALPLYSASIFSLNLMLNDELSILEHHSQTMRLVVANLVAAREQLEALPSDARRDRLFALQQQAIDAANESLSFSAASLRHLRTVGNLYADISVEAVRRPLEHCKSDEELGPLPRWRRSRG